MEKRTINTTYKCIEKDVISMFKRGKSIETIAIRTNIPISRINKILKEANDAV